MSDLLRMSGVTLRRGGRVLVEDLDLALCAGEAIVLTGPNGAGKSSLLRCVAGLLSPASGSVERGAAALADERLAFEAERSLGKALSFWTDMDGGDAASAMDAMGLAGLADVPVRFLSTGQRQRARLARVIASKALLWLLDEPLNGLDADGVSRLDRAIATHRDKGGAVLAASHGGLAGEWREVAL